MDPVLSDLGEGKITKADEAVAKVIAKTINERIEEMIKRASSMYDEMERTSKPRSLRDVTLRYASAPPDKKKSVGGWIKKALGLKALGLDISEYQPPKPEFPGLEDAIKTAIPPATYPPSLESSVKDFGTPGRAVPPAGTPGVSPPTAMPIYSSMPVTGTHFTHPSLGASGSIGVIDDLHGSLIPKADNAFCLSVGPDLDLDFRDFAMFFAREPGGLEIELGLFIHIAGIAVAEDTQHIYCPITGLKYPFSKLIGRYT